MFNLVLHSCHSLICCLPENEPGKLAGSACCSRLVGPSSWPLFFQGHRLPRKFTGQRGLPSGDPSFAVNQVLRVNQLFPVVLAKGAAIISLGHWWKIDSLKHTATGKWNILCPCKVIFYLPLVWLRSEYTYLNENDCSSPPVTFYCEDFHAYKMVKRIRQWTSVYPPLRYNCS